MLSARYDGSFEYFKGINHKRMNAENITLRFCDHIPPNFRLPNLAGYLILGRQTCLCFLDSRGQRLDHNILVFTF
jgi:hypothetical protein